MGPVLTFNRRFTALVFDLDGTLIDSVPQVAWAMNRVFAEDGLALVSLDEVRAAVGFGARAMFDKTLASRRTDVNIDEMIRRYIAAYQEDPAVETVVYDEVREVLTEFSASGVLMGVCTNKPSRITDAVLRALDLDRFFGLVVAADDTPFMKPDGRHVLAVLDALMVDTERAVLVGDSETDVSAGQSAGLATVAVTYGYCHVPFAELGADVLIDTFGKLPNALCALSRAA